VDTAAGLKQSLRDVRLSGPTGTAAATSSLAMARSLASLAKTAADVLTKAKSQWMLTAGMPPPPGYGAGSWDTSTSTSRPASRQGSPGARIGGGGTGGGAAGAGRAPTAKKKTATTRLLGAAPTTGTRSVAARTLVPTDPDADPAMDGLEDVMHDPPAGTAASPPGDASPPEHSTRAPRVRLSPWERQMAKFKRRQAKLAVAERKARRAARRAFAAARGARLQRRLGGHGHATETVMVRRAGCGPAQAPAAVLHQRAAAATPARAAEEVEDLLLAVQHKLKMGVPAGPVMPSPFQLNLSRLVPEAAQVITPNSSKNLAVHKLS